MFVPLRLSEHLSAISVEKGTFVTFNIVDNKQMHLGLRINVPIFLSDFKQI